MSLDRIFALGIVVLLAGLGMRALVTKHLPLTLQKPVSTTSMTPLRGSDAVLGGLALLVAAAVVLFAFVI